MLTSLPLGICYIINPCVPERVKRVFAAYDGRASILTRCLSLHVSTWPLWPCAEMSHALLSQAAATFAQDLFVFQLDPNIQINTASGETAETWTTLADNNIWELMV